MQPKHTTKKRYGSSERLLDKDIILKELNIQSGQTIIDLGCGNGYMTNYFSKIVGDNGTIYAIDVVPKTINNLQKETQETNIVPILADITKEKIKIADASVDLIYLATVFHIFTDEQIKPFQNEVKRLLKPNGKLAILNIEKKEMPFGPPYRMKVSAEKLKQLIQLSPSSHIQLNEYFYMQLFSIKNKI